MDEVQLAELAGCEPGAVLRELAQRAGRAPGTRAEGLVQVFGRIAYHELGPADYVMFKQVLLSLGTAAPGTLPGIYTMVLAQGSQRRCEHSQDLLCQLIRSIPSSVPILISCLEYSFPHYSRPLEQLSNYTHLLVALMRQHPVLRPRLLDLLVEKFLAIDVAIQMEACNLPEELELDAEPGEARPTDLGQEGEGEYEVMDSDLLRRSSSPIALNMVDMMNKLDAALSVLFEYLSTLRDAPAELRATFDGLLQTFERAILPTFRSRCTPFLLFYMASLSPGLTDVFLGFLMKRLYHVFDDPADGRKRTASSAASLLTVVTASYIGSFVARAKFLPANLVRLTFDMLLTWCLRFLGDLPSHLRSGVKALRTTPHMVSERIAVFYAVSQAAMYIFCFRHRLLLEQREDRAAALGNYRSFLLPILQSSLNPLKWCMSAVVEEFSRLADVYDLVNCRQIVDRSARRSAPPSSAPASAAPVHRFEDESLPLPTFDQTGSFLGDLDSYFPFDPLLLRGCTAYISPALYNEWGCDELDSDSDDGSASDAGTSDPDTADEAAADTDHHKDLLICNPAWQSLAVRRPRV